MRKVVLAALLAGSFGCGTAVVEHRIEVVPVHGGSEVTPVAVFDHQMGYSRDWSHQQLGPGSAASPYSTTIKTMPTVTLGTMNDARPEEIAFAIPEITDAGYFLLSVARPARDERQRASYCSYGEYFPAAGAPTIPFLLTATTDQGHWRVRTTVDVEEARNAVEGK